MGMHSLLRHWFKNKFKALKTLKYGWGVFHRQAAGLAALGILFCVQTRAGDISEVTNQGNNDWNASAPWGGVPVATNNYITTTGSGSGQGTVWGVSGIAGRIRVNSANSTFLGGSLTVSSGTEVLLKGQTANASVYESANWILNGGVIRWGANGSVGAPNTNQMRGPINVTANSYLLLGTLPTAGVFPVAQFELTGTITGPGGLTLMSGDQTPATLANAGASATNFTILLSGDLSGYTGTLTLGNGALTGEKLELNPSSASMTGVTLSLASLDATTTVQLDKAMTVAGLSVGANAVAAGTYTASQLNALNYGPTFSGPGSLVIGAGSSSLPVTSPPVISPASSVTAGTLVTVTEILSPVSGNPPFAYQWQSNGVNIGTMMITNSTTNAIAVDTTGFSIAAYNYRVVVTNAFGAVTSAPVALNVVNPAALTPILLTASDAPGTTSFNTAGHWSDGQPPSAASDYSTAGYTLRTPSSASASFSFAGKSLTLAGAGTNLAVTLLTKQEGVANASLGLNLILTNWAVIQNGPNTPATSPNLIFTGTMTFTNGGGELWPANGDLIVQSTVVGSGPIRIGALYNSTQASVMSANVVFAGNLGGYSGSILTVPDTAANLTGGGNASPVVFSNATDQIFVGTLNTGPQNPMVKQAANKLTLAGANPYRGSTTVSAGTLALGAAASLSNTPLITVAAGATLDVSAQAGNFIVGAGQTLQGNGAVVGGLTINGTLALGNSIGKLTISNNLILAGTNLMKLDRTAGLTNDAVTGVGALTYGGTLKLTLAGGELQAGDTFPLFKANSYNGNFAQIIPPSGYTIDSASLAVNGTLRVSAVQTPPAFTTAIGPTATAFLAGDSMTLSNAATGVQPISYQWLWNGTAIPNAHAATLTLTNLQAGQSGSYTLVASNAFGLTTNTFPVAVTVVSLNLNCVATASGPKVVWDSLPNYQYQLLAQTNVAEALAGWGIYGPLFQGTGGPLAQTVPATNPAGQFFSFVATPGFSPTYLINETFNGDVTGSAPDGWNTVTTGGTVAVQDVPSAANQSVQLVTTGTSSPVSASRAFAPVTGRAAVEVKARAEASGTFEEFPSIYSSNGTLAVTVAFSGGNIVSYVGSAPTTIQSFNAGEWYVIRVELNTTTDTYDLYVDGIKKLAGAAFRNPVVDIAKVSCAIAAGAAGTAYFDSVRVYSHAALIGEAPTPVYDVTAYGGVGDGKTINTAAIQNAINACAGSGGSVYLHDGVFRSGMITLKSGMTLFIAPSATLLGSTNDADYPNQNFNTPNVAVQSYKGFVYANGATNVIIDGGGTIDGSGTNPAWNLNGSEGLRPILLSPVHCTNFTVQNVYLKDSAVWGVVPVECSYFTVRNMSEDSRIYGNRDGIDPVDCQHTLIEYCTINTDDDCICPKSGMPVGVNDLTVRYCNVMSLRANGLKFGTRSYGGFSNASFSDVMIKHCGCAGIAWEAVDGANISNITCQGIDMNATQVPFYVIIGYRDMTPTGYPSRGAGSVDMLLFEDIVATNQSSNVGSCISGTIYNGVTYALTNLTFRRCNITFKGGMASQPGAPGEMSTQYPEYSVLGTLPAYGYYLRHARNVTFTNCTTAVSPADVRPAQVLSDATLN